MAEPSACQACGKRGGKLLRCGRCRNVWFCNRECQVVAARQGHCGANCCPADKAPTPAAEVAPRLAAAARPSTMEPGVIPTSLAPAAHSCHACGKSEGKLLRCGQCKNVWFCNRECQVVAARQGHSGANCRPADQAPTHDVANAEVASLLRAAAGPSTTKPGVNSASLALAANSCHACGKSRPELLLCGRCRNAWFCNRECQVVARKELGHRGANCRSADGTKRPLSSEGPKMAVRVDRAKLLQSYKDLIYEASMARNAHTRVGSIAAADTFRKAASVADLIGGAEGAVLRAQADQVLSSCLVHLGDAAAAARAACSAVRAARAAGSRTSLVTALAQCGKVAGLAPGEMVIAARESRQQERRSGPPQSYGGLDLSQEGQVSLPTTVAGLSRLELTYHEAAVAICDAALAAAGNRGSGNGSVLTLPVEAQARASLGICLHHMGEERQRSLKALLKSVELLRKEVRTAATGHATKHAQTLLANHLSSLGSILESHGSSGTVGAETCLREALALGDGLGGGFADVRVTGNILRSLVNLCGEAYSKVGTAEAEAFRSRLNKLLIQMGRSPKTSCSICLEPLAPPADGAAEGAASRNADGPLDSCVRVLSC